MRDVKVSKKGKQKIIQPNDLRVSEWAENLTAAPSQVHLIATGEGVRFIMRLKSKAVVNELIAALVRHRDVVWPELPRASKEGSEG